jgi:4'-phosphopantetheinyl transferase
LRSPEASVAGRRQESRPHVDVWSAWLDDEAALADDLAATLSQDERARAGRFAFLRDRRRFVAGRAFLRAVLGRYLGQPPAAVRLRHGAHGKPALADQTVDLHFNLAHSDDLAVCAVTMANEVGIDIERLRTLPDAGDVAGLFFAPGESAALASLPLAQRTRAFFETWTRKEAFLKALGSGLARPLDSFEVKVGPGQPARLLRTAGDPDEATRFSLSALDLAPDYVAALAVEARDVRVRCCWWTWADRRPDEAGA